ncbi:general substrate transporter [Kockovaella imperatae]|uniref:General substrate transporter n=1 Tax=Kockovaella imperatae TaxID=4999 RepID=A0A1Y1UG69_9TREE|nr:general substrate transporter [Kockovaella imperatae]ORX37012.1 general substrate transporter [Kockovaella imperatae]
METIEGKDVEISHREVLTTNHEPKTDQLIDEALGGNAIEHDLSTLEALRIYKRGVALVALITLTIIMRGYDASVAPTFFALPAFQNRFGHPVPGHGNQVAARWQSALGVSTTVGQVFGSFVATYPMEWYGRRKTLAVYLLLTSAVIPMQVFAPSIQVLTAGEYIGGFFLGAYQVLIPTYSSELLPIILRPYLAGLINTAYNAGGLLMAGISYSFSHWNSEWAYKIPFALQWVWPVIILPIVYLTPESPWWLVRNGKLEEARVALSKLGDENDPRINFDRTVAMMQKTDLFEQKVETGGSLLDCFKGPSRYRTEILIMIFFCQDFAVSPVSAAYFYEQLNIDVTKSFRLNIGGTSIGLFCAIAAAFFLRYFGRRSVYTSGIGVLCVIQMTVGFLQLPPSYNQNGNFATAQIVLLFIASAVYNLTIGPLCYSILTEVPSIRLRSKSVAISIATDAVCGIVTNFVTPYLINPGEANARGKVDFLWGGISFFSFWWCFFRLPETKHRTVEEIDYLFENRVPARRFKGYVIDEEQLRHNLEENHDSRA